MNSRHPFKKASEQVHPQKLTSFSARLSTTAARTNSNDFISRVDGNNETRHSRILLLLFYFFCSREFNPREARFRANKIGPKVPISVPKGDKARNENKNKWE